MAEERDRLSLRSWVAAHVEASLVGVLSEVVQALPMFRLPDKIKEVGFNLLAEEVLGRPVRDRPFFSQLELVTPNQGLFIDYIMSFVATPTALERARKQKEAIKAWLELSVQGNPEQGLIVRSAVQAEDP